MKRKAIIIGEEPQKESKGIEFTHYLSGTEGWKTANPNFNKYIKVVYLGKCDVDGDMFAGYFGQDGTIAIYKGNLNDGTY
jgi:hypothetical protein